MVSDICKPLQMGPFQVHKTCTECVIWLGPVLWADNFNVMSLMLGNETFSSK